MSVLPCFPAQQLSEVSDHTTRHQRLEPCVHIRIVFAPYSREMSSELLMQFLK